MPKVQMLSEEQKNAIENYGDSIQTLQDFVTAVRTRPGQFIGPIHAAGLLNMMRETWQNSLDQIIDPNSPGNWFSFYYNENTLEVEVVDNGLGLPFDDMVRILTQQYTSKNYTKHKGEYSSGYNGVGIKIVKSLSKTFIAESYRYDGKAVRLEFEKGYATTEEPVPIKNKDSHQGTRIYFVPDEEVLGDMDLHWNIVYKLIKDMLSMTPIGSRVDFKAIDTNGVEHKESIINKDGIITNLITKIKNPLTKPITVFSDDGVHKLEAAFCFDTENPDDMISVTSFSNFCPTKEGTHIDGTIDGICRWFVNYMNKIFLSNQKAKSKTVVSSVDIKSGLCLMIAAAHLEPQFTGQAKEILSNPDMEGFCKDTAMRGLDDWSKSNPNDLAKLCKYFKDIADARMKMDKEKIKIVTKYTANALTGLPDKYAKPTKHRKELIIVEGDRAHCL